MSNSPLTTFGNLGTLLFNNGYSVLPTRNKAPHPTQWSTCSIDLTQIQEWVGVYPDHDIGLRCDQALMIDIDVPDEVEAQRVLKAVQGISPNGMVRYRGDTGKLAYLAGRRSTDLPYTVKGQKQYRHPEHGMVEFFDHPGLQMGIFSNGLIGGDYTWDGRSPLGVALNSLPPISIEQWAQIKKTLETLGYRNNASGASAQRQSQDSTLGPPNSGWNPWVFDEVGRLVRKGLSTQTIIDIALCDGWTQTGYTNKETTSQIEDIANRWRAYIENNQSAYEEWRNEWAFVSTLNSYFHIPTMTPMVPAAWKTKNAEYKFEQNDLNGKLTRGSFCDKFLADPFAAKLLNTTFAPEQPRITKDDKLNFWNDTWARLNCDRGSKNGSKAVEVFVVLIAFLCGGRNDIRDHLLDWIGYGLFHPAERVRYAPLLVSQTKGIGKSLLIDTIAKLYGLSSATTLGGLHQLIGKFNGSVLAGKQFVGVHETGNTGELSKYGAMEPLKTLITEDRLTIEFKGKDSQSHDNYCRFFFCSNHADGLQFDPNERRIFPIIFDGEHAKPAGFYDDYVEFCHSEQGLADIALFLSENHSANIHHRAPAGDMSKIQAALLPEWATELMEHVKAFGDKAVGIQKSEMKEIATQLSGHDINPKHLKATLLKLGWKDGKISGQRVYWHGPSKPSMFTVNLLAYCSRRAQT